MGCVCVCVVCSCVTRAPRVLTVYLFYYFIYTLGNLERQSALFCFERNQLVCGMLTAFLSTSMTLRVGIHYLDFVRHTVICIDCHLNSASY